MGDSDRLYAADDFPGPFDLPPTAPSPGPSNIHARCEETRQELEGNLEAMEKRVKKAEGALARIRRETMGFPEPET